jgi:hypothetical protein
VTLASLLDDPGAGLAAVAGRAAELGAADRVAECRALSGAQQRRLWELASAQPARQAGELVPGGRETEVFAGRNSLAMFSSFEKRFARQGTVIAGYNVHPLGRLIGPGYFTVEPTPAGMPLRFDYSHIPAAAPAGWPRVKDNSSILARPVYGGLLDEVVWVTADVLIGSAFKGGRPLGSYFVLARADR